MNVTESSSVRIRNEDAVPLATALVQFVAEAAGVRVLILKGPLAGESGLRARKISSDVDVLVSPSEATRLIDVLAGHGWRPRPWPNFPTVLPPHSYALIHSQWKIDIDVHFNWPGFLLPAGDVFETLWNRRREMSLAQMTVATTGFADTVLVLALHILREAPQKWDKGESIPAFQSLIDNVAAQPGLMRAVRDAARDTGAEQTARPLLESLGFEIEETVPTEAFRAWQLHGVSEHPVSGWLNELKKTPVHKRPKLIWRALFPSAKDLRAIDPAGGDDFRGTVYRWWRRLKRGIRTAPSALRTLRKLK